MYKMFDSNLVQVTFKSDKCVFDLFAGQNIKIKLKILIRTSVYSCFF